MSENEPKVVTVTVDATETDAVSDTDAVGVDASVTVLVPVIETLPRLLAEADKDALALNVRVTDPVDEGKLDSVTEIDGLGDPLDAADCVLDITDDLVVVRVTDIVFVALLMAD